MVLYTVIPLENVLGEDDAEIGEVLTVNVGGVNATVRPDAGGYGVVERLLSTNPEDYLKSELAPGARVWLGPGKPGTI